MSTNHAVRRPGRALRTRLLGAGALVASCAVVGSLTASGSALASSASPHPANKAAAATTLKACYQNKVTLPPIKHVSASAACPSGYSSLTWNQVGPQGPKGATGATGPKGATGATGPQGPAGTSIGLSVTATTQLPLDQAQTLEPMMAAAAAPQDGTYYVNASVMVTVNTGDTVACILGTGGNYQGVFATVGPVANETYETIPLSGVMSLSKGQQPATYCADYTSDAKTVFYDGSMTATLINSATSSGPAVRSAPASKRNLPPAPKHA